MRTIILTIAAAVLTAALGGTVWAATIGGTAKNDVLRGGAGADHLYGLAGNDKLYGLAGNDLLSGGPGNDLIVGGPGADTIVCGPGRDHVSADAKDKVAKDCEVVTGLPKPPAISIDDATVAEGSAGASTLSFAVRLSAASTKIVSVHYVTADGTASATAADYAATNGIVTFQPGSTTGKIDVAVTGDSTIEPDETLTVTLSAPVNGTIADGSATGTIQNDDRSPHPGHYAGTTSQGKAIGFDVAADSASLSNLSFASDLNCTEVPVQIRNLSITIPGPVAVATDRTFSGQFSGGDSDATIAGTMHGSFDPLGKGTGTIRVDFTINTDAGPLHCSSGDLTWSAS